MDPGAFSYLTRNRFNENSTTIEHIRVPSDRNHPNQTKNKNKSVELNVRSLRKLTSEGQNGADDDVDQAFDSAGRLGDQGPRQHVRQTKDFVEHDPPAVRLAHLIRRKKEKKRNTPPIVSWPTEHTDDQRIRSNGWPTATNLSDFVLAREVDVVGQDHQVGDGPAAQQPRRQPRLAVGAQSIITQVFTNARTMKKKESLKNLPLDSALTRPNWRSVSQRCSWSKSWSNRSIRRRRCAIWRPMTSPTELMTFVGGRESFRQGKVSFPLGHYAVSTELSLTIVSPIVTRLRTASVRSDSIRLFDDRLWMSLPSYEHFNLRVTSSRKQKWRFKGDSTLALTFLMMRSVPRSGLQPPLSTPVEASAFWTGFLKLFGQHQPPAILDDANATFCTGDGTLFAERL